METIRSWCESTKGGFQFAADGFDSFIDVIRVSEEEFVEVGITTPIPRKVVICVVVYWYIREVEITAESFQKVDSFQVAIVYIKITAQENWCFSVDFTKIIKTDHESSKIINKTSILSMCWKVNRDMDGGN